MIEKYRSVMAESVLSEEQEKAFAKLRAAILPWRSHDSSCYVALGEDSGSGEWSIVFEDGFWLVFIGERGERFQLSIFPSVWDAVSYAGFRATAGRGGEGGFPVLMPEI